MTQKSLRLQIVLVGRVNAGKSSVLNLLTGQDVSITSAVPGTTTDTVEKNQELHGIGPVTWIDTAGIGDKTVLGKERLLKTRKALQKADVALVVCDGPEVPADLIQDLKIPQIRIHTKADLHAHSDREFWINALDFSARDAVLTRLKQELSSVVSMPRLSLLDGLVKPNDHLVMITPIDAEAPQGRMIVPQVQTLRAALDAHAIVTFVQPEEYPLLIQKQKPDLVICDSQVSRLMVEKTPDSIPCTTFSILFARMKGDISLLIKGAQRIRTLQDGDKVLIAEACTHHAIEDDIARVKIPNLFLKRGIHPDFHWVSGNDFPDDVSAYQLIVHCGACMFNRTQMMNRIERAVNAGTAITNYGLCIAELQGFLDRVTRLF